MHLTRLLLATASVGDGVEMGEEKSRMTSELGRSRVNPRGGGRRRERQKEKTRNTSTQRTFVPHDRDACQNAFGEAQCTRFAAAVGEWAKRPKFTTLGSESESVRKT